MVAAVGTAHQRARPLHRRLITGGRGTRPQSTFDAGVFAAARQRAVEINSRPERADPPDDLIGVALEAGCLFSIDSDAHAPGQLDFLDHGCARAEELGVPTERIVNTWPAANRTFSPGHTGRLGSWPGHQAPRARRAHRRGASRKRRRAVAAYREDDR
jgi:hypothetical protein